MKLVKSLLLGSVAGLAAVAGAQAADLPVKKAVAVDYVRVCSTYGAGYFFIPGSDTCLRISGFAQADYLYIEQEQGRDDFDNVGFRGRARVNFDARTSTEFGLVRAFLRLDGRRQTGVFNSGGEVPGTAVYDIRFPDQAYIQFGGLTAGRAQSFFDFYTYPDIGTGQLTASDTKTQLLAYTFSFGGGLSATISMEDSIERRNFGTPFGTPVGFIAPATVGGVPFFGTTTTGGFVNALVPEGQGMPDVVANLRFDQAWGAAQLSGAIHDLSAFNTFARPGETIARRADDEIGFAVQAGVMFKLPFIAAGDELWLQATYAEGASSYAGTPSAATFGRFTTVRPAITDAFVDQFGNVEKTEVFSVSGKFLHYWLPNLRSNFFGGYQTINAGEGGTTTVFTSAANAAAGTGGVVVGFQDARIWEAGANLIWTPVKQLDIGVEAVYRNFEVRNGHFGTNVVGGTFNNAAFVASTGTAIQRVREDDVWEARLRIQRDF